MTSHVLNSLELDAGELASVAADYERFRDGLPARLEEYVRDKYRLDLSSEYGGLLVKTPFGKASGQLSLNTGQVRRDAEDGLGFVVLKSIIAEDERGGQSMSAWAVHETRMLVERIKGSDGTQGWTVTWKGRGWYDTFDKYLEFFGEALEVGLGSRMPVLPSSKYHLPRPGEEDWKTGEYEYTTRRLLDVWERLWPGEEPMPIEKDFSPTLAGDDRASESQTIIRWLTHVTGLIRRAAKPRPVSVGLKLFNAVFGEDFQLEMLRAVNEACEGEEAPDFLVYANRLFDPVREFDGVRGVAYGGPDLSARNLAVLRRLRASGQTGEVKACRTPLSATGDIASGRAAAEYLLRGASTFQIHTYFQLPSTKFAMRVGSKTARALHELYFNPEKGLVAWLLHLRRAFGWPEDWSVKRMADFCAEPSNRVWAEREPALHR